MYKVQEYGLITKDNDMIHKMQTEIMERGPIVCGMYAHSSTFEEYNPRNMGNYTDNIIGMRKSFYRDT